MSHHYSGPNIGFPRGDARLDLTDLYAFPKPGDPGKSIFIMNVHPSVGLNPARIGYTKFVAQGGDCGKCSYGTDDSARTSGIDRHSH
jgi:hypothetical protein